MLIYLVAKWRGNETLDIPGCEHVYERGFIYLKVVNPCRGIKLKSQYKKKRLPPLTFDNLGLGKRTGFLCYLAGWHGLRLYSELKRKDN